MALTDGLISIWHMNNDWRDSCGINHGTPSGATFSADVKLGAACGSFDGIDDYVNCGSNTSLKTAQGTWAFWEYHTAAFTGGQGILLLGDPSWNNNIRIQTQTVNRLEVWGRIGSEAFPFQWHGLTAFNVVPSNQWNRVVLVQDGIAPKLYVNGVLVLTVSAGLNLAHWTNHSNYSAKNFYIVADGGAGYFNGRADEVVVSGMAWTLSDVLEDYNNGAGMEIWRLVSDTFVPKIVRDTFISRVARDAAVSKSIKDSFIPKAVR